jgi:hypothetical protein
VVTSAAAPGRGPLHTRGRHLVGPLILLGAGVLLLLNNLQIVPWSVWREIWPYWPVLLVLLGLEALVTGRVAWGTLVLLVLLLPILGLVVTASDMAFRWNDATRSASGPATPLARQPLDGATSASVEIEYGGGALDIGPLPAELASDTLADGQVFGHGSLRFDARSTLRNGRRVLQISPRDMGHAFDLGRLELRLTPAIPVDLEIEAGASETTLNLETLRVPNLSIETGASKTRIVLPAQGETKAEIEGGAASIDIVVPPNVAARIILDGGPNRIEIDEQRFPRRGSEYRSASFETATDRVTVRIDVGASRLVVQ